MSDPTAGADLPPLVLVVSDLHLVAGCDPATGRMHPRENFLADDAFARFLAAHRAEVTEGDPLLVINGDLLDFLRLTHVPRTDEEFARWEADLAKIGYTPRKPVRASLVRKELRYGLRTDDYKTVWKFREIVRGHPVFFAALGAWVRGGGRLVFLKGNHDLEFHWPLLHQAIREQLSTEAGNLARGSAIEFHEDRFQIGNVYIEHGHQHEAMTRVEGDPTIFRGEEVRFPFGSFFNKYLINQLEDLDPFLDNVKPTSKVIQVAVRRRPISTIRILSHSIPALRGVIVRESFRHWVALLLLFLILVLPILSVTLALLAFIFQPVRDALASVITSQTLRRGLVVLFALLPWIVAGIKELTRKKKFAHGEDDYGEGAYEALRQRTGKYRRMYAVMGHTHRMDIQDLGAIEGTHCLYLNSGSWTPRWDEHRPDLNGRVEYSFLRFDLEDGEYRHRLLEWRDERNASVPALIYGPPDRP